MEERLADLISEEIKKEDILAPIKEELINSIIRQIKEHGEAHIRWDWERDFRGGKLVYRNPDAEDSDWCISLHKHGQREVPLKMWLSEQGFNYHDAYNREGALCGINVTLPIR